MSVERRIRKSWYHLRRRIGRGAGEATHRMVVEKAPWLHDARCPVMLMIDDLTNAWHSSSGGASWDHGGDWGGGHDAPGSAVRFLEERLLREFPEARVTLFTVAGPISAYTPHQPFTFSAPLDASEASRRFFQRLAAAPQYELAYHGHNHGTLGDRSDGFVQEWRGFESHAEAVAQTATGLATFERTVGAIPRGGKYGGWEYNELAEDAINESGFLWWCRDWMPRDTTNRIPDAYYEPQFFGRNLVVALPSTVHGHYWDPRQIDRLIARQQLISIEEHIAPIRPDGLVQTPNIVDDIDDLRRLYAYLRGKNVWHATGTEVASYVIAREQSLVFDVTRDGFSIRYDGRVASPRLTLRLDCAAICSSSEPDIVVVTPDGHAVDTHVCTFDSLGSRRLVTIPVQQGRYRVCPRAARSEAAPLSPLRKGTDCVRH